MTKNSLGLHGFIDPSQLMQTSEEHDQEILARVAPRVYRLESIDANGKSKVSTAFASGEHGFLLTAGHNSVIKYSRDRAEPAVKYLICDEKGNQHEACCEFCSSSRTDVMLLKCDMISSQHSEFLGAPVSPGDTVYALGVSPNAHEAAISKGIVSSITLDCMNLHLHADEGWVGGVVVNVHGKLVGMITSGDGVKLLHVVARSASVLDVLMKVNGKPGFRS
jgi:CBS domain-containing protein